MSEKPHADEVLENLTGFDEVAIQQAFGADVLKMTEDRPTLFMRALAFAVLRKEGKKDKEAHAEAMGMPMRALQDLFGDEDEPMPAEPVTESGKDA